MKSIAEVLNRMDEIRIEWANLKNPVLDTLPAALQASDGRKFKGCFEGELRIISNEKLDVLRLSDYDAYDPLLEPWNRHPLCSLRKSALWGK